jgi:pyridinium-3,5-biscarboxylic acid mononucleotide synthase
MPDPLDDILERLRQGDLTPAKAREAVLALHAQPLGFATVDHDRRRRCGFAEVVYAAGKSPSELTAIVDAILKHEPCVLVTRTESAHVDAVTRAFADRPIEVGSRGGTVIIGTPPIPPAPRVPPKPTDNLADIPIITAGTSDLPVAEEALLTCKALGHPAVAVNDVGVAGLHRIEPHLPLFRKASVLICIAGMEGALPSVIGGLIEAPIIAVPTSVGYGASFGGVTALLSMLTSCASGVTVVNIDNGFGAAYNACLINRMVHRGTAESHHHASETD